MSYLSRILFLVIFIAVAYWMRCRLLPDESGRPPMFLEIEKLTQLTMLRAEVSDVVVADLKGRFGGARATLLVHGDIVSGVDLRLAHYERVNPDKRTAVMVLPRPHLSAVRIDHRQTRILAITRSGLWNWTPIYGNSEARVVEQSYREAEEHLSNTTRNLDLTNSTRVQVDHYIGSCFRPLGWRVSVRWETEPEH